MNGETLAILIALASVAVTAALALVLRWIDEQHDDGAEAER